MTDKIEIIDFYTTDADVDGPPTLTYAAWCRDGVRETSGDGPWRKDKPMQSVPLPADVRAAIALLIAPELGEQLARAEKLCAEGRNAESAR